MRRGPRQVSTPRPRSTTASWTCRVFTPTAELGPSDRLPWLSPGTSFWLRGNVNGLNVRPGRPSRAGGVTIGGLA